MTQVSTETGEHRRSYCAEKWRLSQAFAAATHEVMELQREQTIAVISGDSDFTRFDDLLSLVREKKNRAKYELVAHLEEHNC